MAVRCKKGVRTVKIRYNNGESGNRLAVRGVHVPIPVIAPKGAIKEESNVNSATVPTRIPPNSKILLISGAACAR